VTATVHEETSSISPFGQLDVAGGHPVAQYIYDIVEADGLRFPTKRRAYLRGPHLKPIRDVLLVSITFDANKFRLAT
jgi:hypothetical protein